MKQTLQNDLLTVVIDSKGAELQSIKSNVTGHEYLWQGDSRFWGRRSPVLFPIVGAVWQGRYRMDGCEYAMSQHGFARDMEFTAFTPADAPDDEAWFVLESSDDTLVRFPRRFRLETGYSLTGDRITVMWRVKNTDSREMSFQIGAHPAFNLPDFHASDPVHGYLLTNTRKLERQTITDGGCVGSGLTPVSLDTDGMLPLDGSTFDHDAIILADSQTTRVSMLDAEHRPYLTLLYSAPVVGLWSPRPDAPFVCIEPWYGRADSVGFDGDFTARPYVNTLAPAATFSADYRIIIDR